jgi:hypothetical protein
MRHAYSIDYEVTLPGQATPHRNTAVVSKARYDALRQGDTISVRLMKFDGEWYSTTQKSRRGLVVWGMGVAAVVSAMIPAYQNSRRRNGSRGRLID